MSTLAEIRTAMASTILGGMPLEAVFVYEEVPNIQQSPAIVIQLAPRDAGDFNGTFARGGDITWVFYVMVFVQRGDYYVAQQELSKLVDPAEEFNIGKAIYDNHTLGLDDTVSNVDGIPLYGFQAENVAISHVAAAIKVTVHTSA